MANQLSRLAARGRALPWATVLTVAWTVAQEGKRRWDRLSRREQDDLVRILRKAHRGPSAIAERDRARLRTIVKKVATRD